MKKNSPRLCALLLYNTLNGADAKKQKEIMNIFFDFIVKKGAFKKGKQIIRELEKYDKERMGIRQLEITSITEPDEATIKRVKKIFGEKSEITKKIDKKILGGIIVKTDNEIFDASLKKQLTNLKKLLKQQTYVSQ